MKLSLRTLAIGAALSLCAGSMQAIDLYVSGQLVGGWDWGYWNGGTTTKMEQDNGEFTFTFETSQSDVSFVVSSAVNMGSEEFNRACLLPVDGDYVFTPGREVAVAPYGKDADCPGLSIKNPGSYTLIVNYNEMTMSLVGMEADPGMPQFQLSGHQPGWTNYNMNEFAESDGTISAKLHLDVLYTSFCFNTTDWKYEYTYCTEGEGPDHTGAESLTIPGAGTYEFIKGWGDCPKAFLAETLNDVDITINWNPNDDSKLKVTLSTASSGVENIAVEDAKAEYFRLDGVSVARENLTPGIYICRKGASTSKVYIK